SVHGLLQRAKQGDRDAVPALRAYLDSNPQVWKSTSDLAQQTERAIVQSLCGPDLLRAECMTRKLDDLKFELIGSNPTPVKNLAAARAALCWLQVHAADLEAAAVAMRDGGATMLSVYAERRLTACNRRYLQTLRSVEVVRRINRPQRTGKAKATRNDRT